MQTYQFCAASPVGSKISVVKRGDGLFVSLSSGNTDYLQFLSDWKAGAEVLNPDGTPAPYIAPETP